MKWPAVICILLQLVLSALYCATFYWLGYSENVLAQSATNPLLFLTLAGILFAIVFWLLIGSLKEGKGRLWMTCAFLIFLAVFFIPMGLRRTHRPLLAMGLRDRIIHESGQEGIRSFARDVTQSLHPADVDHGYYAIKGDFIFLPLVQQGIYGQLKEKYAFLKYRGDSSSGPTVSFHGDVVNVQWGNSDDNWGFCVTVQGERNEPTTKPSTSVLPVSDDIYFYAD